MVLGKVKVFLILCLTLVTLSDVIKASMGDKKPIQTSRATPRAAISNLAVAVKMFKPVIVNDSGEKWEGNPLQPPPGFEWKGDFEPREDLKPGQIPPTMGQLINLAGNAMNEIHGFIQSHEALKSVLVATQRAFAEVEMAILGESDAGELKPATTIEEAKKIKNGYIQMRDVLQKAASSSPEQALKTAQAWVFPNGCKPTLFQGTKETEGGNSIN